MLFLRKYTLICSHPEISIFNIILLRPHNVSHRCRSHTKLFFIDLKWLILPIHILWVMSCLPACLLICLMIRFHFFVDVLIYLPALVISYWWLIDQVSLNTLLSFLCVLILLCCTIFYVKIVRKISFLLLRNILDGWSRRL